MVILIKIPPEICKSIAIRLDNGEGVQKLADIYTVSIDAVYKIRKQWRVYKKLRKRFEAYLR